MLRDFISIRLAADVVKNLDRKPKSRFALNTGENAKNCFPTGWNGGKCFL
jgi:hypothetical protein